MGQYEISPGKVKVIRLSRLLDIRRLATQSLPYPHESMQGIVVTTSDKEISGVVQVPYWKLEFDYGALTLKPAKLKTITFTAEPEKKLGSTPECGCTGRLQGPRGGHPRRWRRPAPLFPLRQIDYRDLAGRR